MLYQSKHWGFKKRITSYRATQATDLGYAFPACCARAWPTSALCLSRCTVLGVAEARIHAVPPPIGKDLLLTTLADGRALMLLSSLSTSSVWHHTKSNNSRFNERKRESHYDSATKHPGEQLFETYVRLFLTICVRKTKPCTLRLLPQ